MPMCMMSMVDPKPVENLRPYRAIPENVSKQARMACILRPDLRLGVVHDLTEKHWKAHLDKEPESAPVFMMHISWNRIDQAGTYSIAIGNGNDALTSYIDDGLVSCPSPRWPEEARLSKDFVRDFLSWAYVDNIADYTSLMDIWKEQFDVWHPNGYTGQAAFFIPLRDPNMIFLKEDNADLSSVLAFTDLTASNHSLLQAQQRASALPPGILDWCPERATSGSQVRLFIAQ